MKLNREVVLGAVILVASFIAGAWVAHINAQQSMATGLVWLIGVLLVMPVAVIGCALGNANKANALVAVTVVGADCMVLVYWGTSFAPVEIVAWFGGVLLGRGLARAGYYPGPDVTG